MALTAVDLGGQLKDNEYGWGLIQCLPAIEYPRGDIPALACPARGAPEDDG